MQSDFDRKLAAVFAQPEQVAAGAHACGPRLGQVLLKILRMLCAKSLGNEQFDRLAQQFLARIAECAFDFAIHQGDSARCGRP